MALSHAVLRSRSIREVILHVLHNCGAASPDIAVLARHIYDAFSDGRVPYGREEIDAEIADLIEDGMIGVHDVPDVGPMPMKGYKIKSRGRDFFRAGCPWAKIDEFTGAERA